MRSANSIENENQTASAILTMISTLTLIWNPRQTETETEIETTQASVTLSAMTKATTTAIANEIANARASAGQLVEKAEMRLLLLTGRWADTPDLTEAPCDGVFLKDERVDHCQTKLHDVPNANQSLVVSVRVI